MLRILTFLMSTNYEKIRDRKEDYSLRNKKVKQTQTFDVFNSCSVNFWRVAYFSSLLFVCKIVTRQAECQLFWQICFLSIWNDNPFPKKKWFIDCWLKQTAQCFWQQFNRTVLSNFNPVWSLCHQSEHILFPTYGQLYYLQLCA